MPEEKSSPPIIPEMTVLDIVSRFEATEEIFKSYDAQAGECICCNSLFEPLKAVIKKYGLDENKLLADLLAKVRDCL